MRSDPPPTGHCVYFIGAGPGHPKYLTLEAVEALGNCVSVYAVDPYPETFASRLSGKTVRDPFGETFDDLVAQVLQSLEDGPVGFLVPGDMTVFSPFFPLVERFAEASRVVAGVGTLNAAAALLRRTLDMPGVSRSVVLASPKIVDRAGDPGELGELARAADTLVLYMNNRPLDVLAEELSAGFGPRTPVAIASKVGLADERLYRCTLATMAEAVGGDDIFGLISGDPSLAIIIVGDVLQAESSPSFWNRRKEKFWDRRRGRGGDTETR